MPKLFAVVRREFVERVRTRAFLIGTIMGPLMFFIIGQLPRWMFGKPSGAQAIAVVDATSAHVADRLLGELRAERLGEGNAGPLRYRFVMFEVAQGREGATRDSLVPSVDRRDGNGHVVDDALTGILVVTDSGMASGRLTYYGSNVSSLGDMGQLEREIRTAIVRERMHGLGIGDSVAVAVTTTLDLTTAKISKGRLTGEGAEAAFALSYAIVLILFFALMPTGVQVMSAVVEEKSNRILEVLVSSVRPFDLMFGKILGVGAASILQLGIWAASAIFVRTAFGGSGDAMQSGVSGAAHSTMPIPNIPADLIVVVLIYFALGFLFFTAAYAAVGAMCNTVQETQQLAFPISAMLLVGYFGAITVTARPDSMFAKVMSFVPFTAPFIVPARWSNASLPLPELLLSIACCIAGVLLMGWFAARIYRVGILSYGKRPSLREMLAWVRHD